MLHKLNMSKITHAYYDVSKNAKLDLFLFFIILLFY